MKPHTLLWLLLPLLFFTSRIWGQEQSLPSGKVEIIQDERTEKLLEKHKESNKNPGTMEGFRIQVFSDSGNNSKTKAHGVQEDLRFRYPETGVYLSFKSPNYRVRVGDFRTKLDAQRFLVDISIDFPNAFIVNDQIELPKSD